MKYKICWFLSDPVDGNTTQDGVGNETTLIHGNTTQDGVGNETRLIHSSNKEGDMKAGIAFFVSGFAILFLGILTLIILSRIL